MVIQLCAKIACQIMILRLKGALAANTISGYADEYTRRPLQEMLP